MKLNQKLVSQMRAVTGALLRKGPTAAATTVVKQAMQNASAVQQALQPLRAPKQETAPLAPALDPLQVAEKIVPDMLARLGRLGDSGSLLGRAPGGAQPLPGTFSSHSYTNAAGTRSYKLYVPSSYDGKPAPLVVMLHGCTQDPDDFAAGTQMNVLAEEAGCLVAYPAQAQQANPARCWNWFNAQDQQRDQGEPSIIAGITREVMGAHAVDPARVYVAGLSAGGAMAAIMGTLYPDLYAAVGVHSGLPFGSATDLPSALAAMKGELRRQQAPGRAMPIIVFHGDQDTTVHPANGEAVIAQGARQVSQDIAVRPGQVKDGHAYTRTLHQRADGSVHAEHWLVHGAGHAWFGGSAHGSYTDGRGPDASREMMRFFRTQK